MHDGVELAISDFSIGLAEIFSFAADRDVVRIQRHVHPARFRDACPQVAWLEHTIAPGAVTRIDIAVERAVQPYGVVRRPLGRAVQELRDCAGLTACFRVQDERDRWSVGSAKPAVATSPAANGNGHRG